MRKDFCDVAEALRLERLGKGLQLMISNPTWLVFPFSDLLVEDHAEQVPLSSLLM